MIDADIRKNFKSIDDDIKNISLAVIEQAREIEDLRKKIGVSV